MNAERDEQASKRARTHFLTRNCDAFYEKVVMKRMLLLEFLRAQQWLNYYIDRSINWRYESAHQVTTRIYTIMEKIKELEDKLKRLENMHYPGIAECFLDFVQNLAIWTTHARMQLNLYKAHGDTVTTFYRHYIAMGVHQYGPAPAPTLSHAWTMLVGDERSTHTFTRAFMSEVPTMYFFDAEEEEVHIAYKRFQLYGLIEDIRRGPNKDKTRNSFGAGRSLTFGKYHTCALMCSLAYAGTKFELPLELWDKVFKCY